MTKTATPLWVGFFLTLILFPGAKASPAGGEPAKYATEPVVSSEPSTLSSLQASQVLTALIEQLRPLQINGPHVDFTEELMDARLNLTRWQRRPRAFGTGLRFGRSGSKRGRASRTTRLPRDRPVRQDR